MTTKITIDTSQLRNFGNQLQQQVDTIVQGELASRERTARALTCSEHGERPTFTRARAREGYKWRVEGCCEALVGKAQAVLANGS